MQDFPGLPETLCSAMAAKGFGTLTPVQVAVTQDALAGLDLLVSAQTGSGKTVAFGLAMAADILDQAGRLGRPATPVALIIAPTRELAMQVRREFDWLFAGAGIVTASSVGGMDARAERRSFERGAHVIVATPGRLRDHVARGSIDLGDLRAVVLDEADEMLDMGFSEDLEFILDHTPAERRTLLFSATVPRGIARLAQTYQKDDAQRIEVGSKDTQHADISYLALNVTPSDIEKAIINLLRYHDAQTAIIFANTRAMVARLTAKFSNRGFSVVSLSGELSQAERTNALQALRDGRARVCIATDVAARGIDLPSLELVIHADLPSNAESLLHRSGRTGRAGRKGTSVLVVSGRQRSKAQRLLKFAKLEAEWRDPPSAEDVLARDEERLLSDPVWSDPPSEEEEAFSARLLEEHSPEQIAAAYLRLYRERNSAPEILGTAPETEGRKRREPASFGPSTWFSLSLGRKQRAEPRWLLPMLCRNAGLSKDAIGAIRVQYQETFVEILTAAVPAIKKELGPELDIEQGARLTELNGLPDFEASPKGPPAAPHDTRADAPRKSHRSVPDGPASGESVAGVYAPEASRQADEPSAPRKPQKARSGKPHHGKPGSGKPQYGKPKFDKPKSNGGKSDASKFDKSRSDKPRSDGPKSGKSKPVDAKSGKPKTEHGKASGPQGAPHATKGGAKPAKRRSNAADPSQPLGARKSRHAAQAKDKGAARVGNRTGKGPDARPRRKPSRTS